MSESHDKPKRGPPPPPPRPTPPPRRPPVPRPRPAPPLPALARQPGRSRRLLWLGVAIGGATVVVALAVLLIGKLLSQSDTSQVGMSEPIPSEPVPMVPLPSAELREDPATPPSADAAPKPATEKPKPPPPAPEEKKPTPSAPVPDVTGRSGQGPSVPRIPPRASLLAPGNQTVTPPRPLDAGSQAVPAKPGGVSANLGARERVLELPPLNTDDASDRLTELARIPIAAANACELSILGAEALLGGAGRLELSKADPAPGSDRSWSVVSHGDMGKPLPVAALVLKDGRLWFQWKRAAAGSSVAAKLPFCLLEVKTPGESVRYALRRAKLEPLVAFPFGGPACLVSIPLDPRECPDRRQLRLELQPEGFPGLNLDSRPVLAPSGRWTVDIPSPNALDQGLLAQIEVLFKLDGGCALAFRTTFHTKEFTARTGAVTEKKVVIRPDRLPQYRKDWGKLSEAKDKKGKQLEDCKKTLAQLQAMRAPAYGSSPAAVAEALRQANMVNAAQLAERQLTQELRCAEAVTARGEALLKLLGDLEAKARLGYVVYIEVEGEKVTLVRTVSQGDGK